MAAFVINILNGISFGIILFLLASGLSIIIGSMGILNLSHGALYLLGGYVGARYIDHDYAITMLHRMIECNAYLSQKQSIYKKTAITMINQGIYQPVYLENYE